MYNDHQAPSCGFIGETSTLEEESPRVPEIHLAFGKLRDKMDSINRRLESIVNVLRGEACDRNVPTSIKEVEPLPHRMGLISNFDTLEKRIDEASETVENLYAILGMEQGKLY